MLRFVLSNNITSHSEQASNALTYDHTTKSIGTIGVTPMSIYALQITVREQNRPGWYCRNVSEVR